MPDRDRCYWARDTDGLWHFIPMCWPCIHDGWPEPSETRQTRVPDHCSCQDSFSSVERVRKRIFALIDGNSDNLTVLRKMRKALEEIAKETHEPDDNESE